MSALVRLGFPLDMGARHALPTPSLAHVRTYAWMPFGEGRSGYAWTPKRAV